ncbi:hypothetical protein HDU76_010585 [Blyttiomyces sp. JEL0837]|nr:hypothetical protein HDU76_010585 [Blyttiomyces sp. JEL0837]
MVSPPRHHSLLNQEVYLGDEKSLPMVPSLSRYDSLNNGKTVTRQDSKISMAGSSSSFGSTLLGSGNRIAGNGNETGTGKRSKNVRFTRFLEDLDVDICESIDGRRDFRDSEVGKGVGVGGDGSVSVSEGEGLGLNKVGECGDGHETPVDTREGEVGGGVKDWLGVGLDIGGTFGGFNIETATPTHQTPLTPSFSPSSPYQFSGFGGGWVGDSDILLQQKTLKKVVEQQQQVQKEEKKEKDGQSKNGGLKLRIDDSVLLPRTSSLKGWGGRRDTNAHTLATSQSNGETPTVVKWTMQEWVRDALEKELALSKEDLDECPDGDGIWPLELREPKEVMVGRDFVGTSEDEIDLCVGDLVLVSIIFEDGWANGVLIRTGKPGVFPLDWVVPVSK